MNSFAYKIAAAPRAVLAKTLAVTAILAASSALSGPALAASQPAYTPGGFQSQPSGGTFTMGFSFSAGANTFVNGLGAYDDGRDGFPAPMQVGLWDNAGTLLLSTTVTSADTLIGAFRYSLLPSYELTAGATYVVGAFRYAGTGETYATGFGGGTTAPGVTTFQARYNDSGVFAFPNLGVNTNGYFGANALVGDRVADFTTDVPEPATWAMMGLGFGLLGIAIRRRRATVSFA